MFEISPVNGTLGAEIGGIDLAVAPDAETKAKLNEAFVEHKVLFFRDQGHLTSEQFLAFGGWFGEIDPHPFLPHLDGYPDIAVLTNTGAEHQHSSGVDEQRWHSDATFLSTPPAASILRAVDVPPYGRDTIWADMAAAYAALSGPMKRMLDGLTAFHDWSKSFEPYFTPGARIDQQGTVKKAVGSAEAHRAAYPVVEHPVVRTHPVSGCKALYVNPNFTVNVAGMRPDESRALLDFLYAQVQIVSFQVRLGWAPGTIAMWDNRSTQHAVALDYPYPRVMHRLTIKGTPPQ